MHPVLKEGVTIGIRAGGRNGGSLCYVRNAAGDEFEISRDLYRELLAADGTRALPFQKNKTLVQQLKEQGVIRTSRFVAEEGGIRRFILLPLGSRTKRFRPLCRVLNRALPLLALLLLAAGIVLIQTTERPVGLPGSTGYGQMIALAVLSVLLHEVGHLIAGVAADYTLLDMGILLWGIFPVGAYVSHEEERNAPRRSRIQFALAGVEVNFLLVGLFLIVSARVPTLFCPFIAAANINMALALVNLMPAVSLDGEAALSALLDVRSIGRIAGRCLFRAQNRRELCRCGVKGYICLCLMAVIVLCRVLLGLLTVLDILCLLFFLW